MPFGYIVGDPETEFWHSRNWSFWKARDWQFRYC